MITILMPKDFIRPPNKTPVVLLATDVDFLRPLNLEEPFDCHNKQFPDKSDKVRIVLFKVSFM
jgi:hypothetical protein